MIKYEQRLGQLVEILKEFKPKKIYAFGSWIWGNNTKDSDIDLAIVVDPKVDRLKIKSDFSMKLLDSKYPFDLEADLHVIAEDVFKYRLSKGDPFVSDIAKGKLVYGS